MLIPIMEGCGGMEARQARVAAFRALHFGTVPLVLFNVWDPGSARAVAGANAAALATGSWSVAAANGYADGEHVPLDMVLDNVRRIAAATDLPVSLDIESGYGLTPEEVAGTIARVVSAGVVGCNLEDSFPEDGTMRPLAMQTERIAAARRAADPVCRGFFINARTDVFFQKPPADHGDDREAQVIERAAAYADAGADGIFVPGLTDVGSITRICGASSLPVNVMMGEGSPSPDRLAAAGVARISHGPGPYVIAMAALRDAAALAISAQR